MRTILIRYGEIFLKGNNRSSFESQLLKNIKKTLFGIDYKLVRHQARYSIEEYLPHLESEIIERLQKVAGIHSISPAEKVNTDILNIQQAVLAAAPDRGTFRVSVNRADKSFPVRSMQFAADIGAFLLENRKDLSVDLHNFQTEIQIDIRENHCCYIFSKIVKGVDGMPIGTGGRGLLLLSGGIDSPVAGFRMLKRGMELYAIHYHSYPYTSEKAKQKVIDLAKKLSFYGIKIKLFIVQFTQAQLEIHKKCKPEFMITIMRRIMMRIAEKIAKSNQCSALVTGESLGQVASQTIQSITVTNDVVRMPVLRPLIGMDKLEIIETAQQIDTYQLSILPYEDCCTIFLPKNPVIKPKLKDAEAEEAKLDIDALITDALNNCEILDIEIENELDN